MNKLLVALSTVSGVGLAFTGTALAAAPTEAEIGTAIGSQLTTTGGVLAGAIVGGFAVYGLCKLAYAGIKVLGRLIAKAA